MKIYLKNTKFLDYKTSQIQAYIADFDLTLSQKELAVKLFYKVRDGFLYDPFHLNLQSDALVASKILKKNRAWCVEKSIVYAAAARGLGIPSRLGYGIVINHLGVEKLEKYLQRKEIVFHGYVEVYLDNKWIKTTPAFDSRVCKINKTPTLEWDGETDALFHSFNQGKQWMEYIHDYGTFSDVPVQLMNSEMKKYYPHLFVQKYDSKSFSFFHE